MDDIVIRPGRLSCFTDKKGAVFIVLTDTGLKSRIRFEEIAPYSKASIICVEGGAGIEAAFWQELPPYAHVLAILPSMYFRSPRPEDLTKKRQLAVMACYSTPADIVQIKHFIEQAEKTDPAAQQRIADELFERGSLSGHLLFIDDRFGCELKFEHQDDGLTWHEQAGSLSWGEQQLFPCGEVSTLPVSVFGQNIDSTLKLNGELALFGMPVLHGGNVSYRLRDQLNLFNRLNSLNDGAVIASIVDGKVLEWMPAALKSKSAADALNDMCAVDSRYSVLVEVGFGININLSLLPGNNAMNEVYGGSNGCPHFGFGLLPFTQYHLDIICPDVRVVNDKNEVIFGYSAAQ